MQGHDYETLLIDMKQLYIIKAYTGYYLSATYHPDDGDEMICELPWFIDSNYGIIESKYLPVWLNEYPDLEYRLVGYEGLMYINRCYYNEIVL